MALNHQSWCTVQRVTYFLEEWRAVRVKTPSTDSVGIHRGMVIRDVDGSFLLGRCLISQGLMEVNEGEA
ncbi:hypothetical protein ACS0TY_031953 [Phlomoides rotata]